MKPSQNVGAAGRKAYVSFKLDACIDFRWHEQHGSVGLIARGGRCRSSRAAVGSRDCPQHRALSNWQPVCNDTGQAQAAGRAAAGREMSFLLDRAAKQRFIAGIEPSAQIQAKSMSAPCRIFLNLQLYYPTPHRDRLPVSSYQDWLTLPARSSRSHCQSTQKGLIGRRSWRSGWSSSSGRTAPSSRPRARRRRKPPRRCRSVSGRFATSAARSRLADPASGDARASCLSARSRSSANCSAAAGTPVKRFPVSCACNKSTSTLLTLSRHCLHTTEVAAESVAIV